MKPTKELLEKARKAETAEELRELAEDEGMELTAEEAEKAFAELRHIGELSDNELDNVSGGCGRSSPTGEVKSSEKVVFLYKEGQKVEVFSFFSATKTAYITKCYVKQIGDSYFPYYKVKYLNNDIADVWQDDIQKP